MKWLSQKIPCVSIQLAKWERRNSSKDKIKSVVHHINYQWHECVTWFCRQVRKNFALYLDSKLILIQVWFNMYNPLFDKVGVISRIIPRRALYKRKQTNRIEILEVLNERHLTGKAQLASSYNRVNARWWGLRGKNQTAQTGFSTNRQGFIRNPLTMLGNLLIARTLLKWKLHPSPLIKTANEGSVSTWTNQYGIFSLSCRTEWFKRIHEELANYQNFSLYWYGKNIVGEQAWLSLG